MSNKNIQAESEQRRKFLKKTGAVAVAAPAVTLLMAAGVKPVQAQGYAVTGKPTLVPLSFR